MTYLVLFLEFFKIGLFAVGGGLSTLPFLSELAGKYTWFDEAMLGNMIAVSQSTPGPIGINMATYAGFNAAGILGGIIATVGLVTPSVIVIIIVAHVLNKFKKSQVVQAIFYALRPAVAPQAINDIIIDKMFVIYANDSFMTTKINKHPIFFIALGAVVGILMGL